MMFKTSSGVKKFYQSYWNEEFEQRIFYPGVLGLISLMESILIELTKLFHSCWAISAILGFWLVKVVLEDNSKAAKVIRLRAKDIKI